MEELARDIQDELNEAIERTGSNRGMLFNIALNYGGRAEIVDAARRAIESGVRPEDLDEQRFASRYTAGQPDPDLLIRTSGEMRVSNYLLWQIAYRRSMSPIRCGQTFAAGTSSKPCSRIRSASADTAESARGQSSARNDPSIDPQGH